MVEESPKDKVKTAFSVDRMAAHLFSDKTTPFCLILGAKALAVVAV
jgi:hypothetical protein